MEIKIDEWQFYALYSCQLNNHVFRITVDSTGVHNYLLSEQDYAVVEPGDMRAVSYPYRQTLYTGVVSYMTVSI